MKVLRKVQVTTLPYRCSCSSKYLVIFETAVYCRRVVWFHVFCTRQMNEGGDAETELVDI